MHMLLDRVAEEGQHAPEAAAESEKAIALKVRKFFIPLLSLVESYEGTMPEVTLAIRKLLENEQVNFSNWQEQPQSRPLHLRLL